MGQSIRQWLKQHLDYLTAQYQQGRSTCSLDKEMGVSTGHVYLLLRDAGRLDPERSQRNARGDDSLNDRITELHAGGKSAYAIGKLLRVDRELILNRGARLGLSFSRHSKLTAPDRLKDQVPRVCELYRSGLTTQQIAKRIGHARYAIQQLLMKEGFTFKLNTYDVDLHYFDVIDTEPKAYLLGLWYADGAVTDGMIKLHLTDRELVEFAAEQLGYTGKIAERAPASERRKPTYSLSINRQALAEALTRLGCTPRKSLTLRFPGPEIVPAPLLHHFVRGYFDGDGSLYRSRNGRGIRWTAEIVGTRHFLEGIGAASGIPGFWCQRHPERMKDNWSWRVGAAGDLRQFLGWLYRDGTAFLSRKHELYRQFRGQ